MKRLLLSWVFVVVASVAFAAQEETNVFESPGAVVPANRIDELVFAQLKSLGTEPVLCSDSVFVRRAFLDVVGALPTAREAKEFIRDRNPNKRAALVDQLLERREFADYWAMKWGDVLRIKAEFPVNLWPNAAQAYHHWVREAIAQNKPYNQFARELLTSSGSNFRVGPVNFYRAVQNRTPEGISGAVAQTFMGARVEKWPAEKLVGMAVFFSQIGYKPTSEWKEEQVFWDPLGECAIAGNTAPGRDSVAAIANPTNTPYGLGDAATTLTNRGPVVAQFPDRTKVTLTADRDPREVFADWLMRPGNPWFARSIVNRVWAWLLGRGIIHEPDDIRDDNPPSNPMLLAYLEKELASHNYDLKHLYRLILTSRTYQLSSMPRLSAPEVSANFASYPLRRLDAEVLIDAINKVTGSSDLYTSPIPEPFTYVPKGTPAVAIADGSITSPFLAMFGRSARATGLENERNNRPTRAQALYLLNSTEIQRKFEQGTNLSAVIGRKGKKSSEVMEGLYLTILSRFPTPAERKVIEDYGHGQAKRGTKTDTVSATEAPKTRDDWIDVAWALLNSEEFLYRH